MRLQLYRLRQIARRPGNFIVDKIPRLMPSRFFLAFFLKWSVACRASKEKKSICSVSKTRLHAHVCAHIATLRSTRTDTAHTLPCSNWEHERMRSIHHFITITLVLRTLTIDALTRHAHAPSKLAQAGTKKSRAHTHTHHCGRRMGNLQKCVWRAATKNDLRNVLRDELHYTLICAVMDWRRCLTITYRFPFCWSYRWSSAQRFLKFNFLKQSGRVGKRWA